MCTDRRTNRDLNVTAEASRVSQAAVCPGNCNVFSGFICYFFQMFSVLFQMCHKTVKTFTFSCWCRYFNCSFIPSRLYHAWMKSWTGAFVWTIHNTHKLCFIWSATFKDLCDNHWKCVIVEVIIFSKYKQWEQDGSLKESPSPHFTWRDILIKQW